MGKIVINKIEKYVEDGDKIREVCEYLGITFGCRHGVCGVCKIEIIDGSENLDELTKEEKEMGERNATHRLACQARIKQGTVTLKQE